ncbi:MAG: DedA family protein [Chloroflexota bacterium]|nr:DedA family protein [Chloroflexota bacterium]
MPDIPSLLDTYGVLLLFAIILLKEIGIPVPIPGDLLMLLAGARAATGNLALWEVLLAATIAGFAGAFVQYFLARGPGRGIIYRFGKYVGLTPARLDRASATIKSRGWVAIALARALPGLRIGAVAACGLASVPLATFAIGLLAGTILFVGFHTLLGFFAGPGVGAILSNLNIPLLPLVLLLAIIGMVGWLIIKRRQRTLAADDGVLSVLDWADACCPACLAAAALEKRLVPIPAQPASS